MRTLAVLSLASGIGLAAALAAIVDAILLRPLPVELSRVFTASPGQPFGFVSYPDFEDFGRAAPMVAQCPLPVLVDRQIKMALAVTPDYFEVLGLGPRFTADDQAVLAHGTPRNIGRTLRIGPKLYTVIGIAPAGFGLDRFLHEDLYIPMDASTLRDRSRRFLTVFVRGKNTGPKISAIAASLEQQYPDTNRGRRAVVLTELTARLRTDKMMPPLAGLLSTLAALILAIACTNACGVLMIRRQARANITAIKIALGASPLRLFSELLRESASVAALGCALALPCAWVVIEILRRSVVLPTDFPISIAAHIDRRVIAFAAASAVAATLVCQVRLKARNLAATIEIAIAAALAATGASLWAGLNTAKHTDLGYRTDHLAVMTFDPAQSGYDETRTRSFYRDLMEHVKSLPGVRAVALAQSVPLSMTGAQRQIRIGDAEESTVWINIVTPEYFDLMRIPFIAGHVFDRDGAIVNEELSKRIAVGQKMRVNGSTLEVVGIVKNAKYRRWDEPPRPFLYLPYQQNYASRMTLHIEAGSNIFGAVPRILPASDVRMLREYFDHGAMFGVNAALRIAEVTGAGGLLLALTGLYGAVSSTVRRRRREIAIRMALGALPHSIFALIVRQQLLRALTGIAAGLLLANLGCRLLRGFVPGAGASSWSANAGTAALMIVASFIACAIPTAASLRRLNIGDVNRILP